VSDQSAPHCFICDKAAVVHRDLSTQARVECKKCGTYRITHILEITLRNDPDYGRLRPYLSAYLRQSSERGESPELDVGNWKKLAESHQHTSIPRQIEKLLKLFCDRSEVGGQQVTFGDDDFPLLDAVNAEGVFYLV
jgi:hypothetical protein